MNQPSLVALRTSGHPLLMATRNNKKRLELEAILTRLGLEVETLDACPEAPEVEETGETFEENARLKAVTVARAVGRWTLADDSGLSVDALGGRPGVHSARFSGPDATDASNRALLIESLAGVPLEQRAARFICVIALSSPDGSVRTWRGECEGRILEEPRGKGGFGYDPLFQVVGRAQTMAELPSEEKNRLSHRAHALAAMEAALSGVNGRADA